MYKLFTKNGQILAIKSNGDETFVYLGKIDQKSRFKLRNIKDNVDIYEHQILNEGYKHIGIAVFTTTGKLLSVDTFDTLYWEIRDSNISTVDVFKESLMKFVDILQSELNISLKHIDEDPIFLIEFSSVSIGISVSKRLNILNFLGEGSGQISLSQSEDAFWLILYLHANGCIKLLTSELELKKRSQYPRWISEFSQSKPDYFQALGLGSALSRIKPLF